MSIITPQDVERIAALARLGITKEEVQGATHNLSNILNYFSTIQKIDTSGAFATDAPSSRANITREDIAVPEVLCSTAELLERAPLTQSSQIKVRAVFT